MTRRTTTRTVTFKHPFVIEGLEGWQPAGSYVVDTEEELLQGLSFPAWRRVHTSLQVPQRPGSWVTHQDVTVDPAIMDAALMADEATG
jgi:hypothetical protein